MRYKIYLMIEKKKIKGEGKRKERKVINLNFFSVFCYEWKTRDTTIALAETQPEQIADTNQRQRRVVNKPQYLKDFV